MIAPQRRSNRKLLGLFVLAAIFLNSATLLINAATTADWGDVVNVYYSLYLDAAHTNERESGPITHIYLARGSVSIPQEIENLNLDPQASSNYLEQFKEGIIGIQVNQENEFTIPAADNPYDDPEVSDRDLYFQITLLKIVYDAPDDTTTPTNESPSPSPDFGFLLAAGAGISLLVGGFLLRGYRTSQRMESALSDKTLGTRRQDQVLKKEQSQLQELRELTESLSDPHDELQKKEPAKIRRRR